MFTLATGPTEPNVSENLCMITMGTDIGECISLCQGGACKKVKQQDIGIVSVVSTLCNAPL